MASIISVSIDLDKLDKTKMKTAKNGHRYYDLTIFVKDEMNKFGKDVMVCESVSKEEREAGTKNGNILGAGKVVWKKDYEARPADFVPPAQQGTLDNLPF